MRILCAALLAAALAAAATACDVCSGLSVHEEPATEVVLPSTGDLAACACAFVFVYSAGPTPGRVTLSATPGVGTITVYGDAAGAEVIAVVPEAGAAEGFEVYSRTGTIRVDVATVAAPPPSSSITLSSTAINAAPVITERDGLLFGGIGGVVLIPFSLDGDPFPVTLRDYDNFDQGLRVELEIEVADPAFQPSMALSIPAIPGVVFEEGAADTLSRRVVVSGPGSAVEEAVNNGHLIPVSMQMFEFEVLVVSASDLGSGEGGSQASSYTSFVGVRGYLGRPGYQWVADNAIGADICSGNDRGSSGIDPLEFRVLGPRYWVRGRLPCPRHVPDRVCRD